MGIDMHDALLIDDYGGNLTDWNSHGGKAVKFFNGRNGTKGKNYLYSLSFSWSAEKIAEYLVGILQ